MIIRILFMAAAIGCVLVLFNRALDAANSALEARRDRRALKAIAAERKAIGTGEAENGDSAADER